MFRSGHHDDLNALFGFKTIAYDGEDAVQFGGGSKSYAYELSLEGPQPTRPILWQSHTPFKVQPARPRATISDGAAQWARDTKKGGKLVLLFPFANYSTRTWPLQKWLHLAWHLHNNGISTMAMHTSIEGLERFPYYGYGYSLENMAAMMQEADLVIANDSGTAHLAGTLGVKTFAIMGPTNPTTVFGYCAEVTPLRASPDVIPCVGCHFKAKKGYKAGCDVACDALAMLDWKIIYKQAESAIMS